MEFKKMRCNLNHKLYNFHFTKVYRESSIRLVWMPPNLFGGEAAGAKKVYT